MMRGAIDLVQPQRIAGWIYCGPVATAAPTVLAFVDGRCVGAGRIDLVREDLKQAGLGDGRLGFSFPIQVADEADLARVVVKLEGSDFALLQKGAKVARREAGPERLADPQRTEWLRSKGLLAPAEAAFLRSLHRLGAVDHSLVVPRSAAQPKADIADPLATAQGLFDLAALRPTQVRRIEVAVRDAAELIAAARGEGGAGLAVVAIHARQAGALSIVEGSQSAGAPVEGLEGAIDYAFGPDRLLFLDLDARFELADGRPAELSVFVAC